MRSFFYNLDKVIQDSTYGKNYEILNFCYEVKEFVMKGSFTKYKKAKELLAYWGEPDSYVSKMIGMKEGTIRVTRRNLSNELYEAFGYDFFTILYDGSKSSLEEAKCRLSIANKNTNSNTYLYRELIDAIRRDTKCTDDVDITSCMSEIQFLLKHSKKAIEKELSMLDKSKLLYIIGMLDNEVGSYGNIVKLIGKFENL